ncbi:MAG: VWA domain-containing protein [Acidobacteriota bacterium]
MTRRRACVSAAVATLAALSARPHVTTAQRAAVSIDVRAVAMDVLVTREGRPVTSLTAADFTVLDNGLAQHVDVVRLDAMPITLLLVLDTSASVQGPTLAGLKGAARAAAAALGPKDSIGLLTFSDRVRLRLAPTPDLSRLGPALQASSPGGETRLYDAVYAALEQRRQTPGRILVLAFSEGVDSASWLDPLTVVRAARRGDAVVHVVSTEPPEALTPHGFGLTSQLAERFEREPLLYGRHFLARLAEDTGGVLQSSVAGTLGEAFVGIVNEYRSRYLLSYQPVGVDSSGWHTIDVKVNGRGLEVRARRGYQR